MQIFTRLLFLNIKQTIIPVIVLLGSLLVSALWIFKKTKERGALIALWIWFAVGVIGLSSYKQHIYDHYFGFLFPVPFLIVAWMIVRLWRGNADCAMCVYLQRFWGGAIFLMTVYLMYIHNPLHQAPNQQYSKVQQTIDAIMQHAGTRSFNFALLSKQNYDEGYRFAFESKHAQLIALDPSQTASITELLYVVCENSDLPNAPEDEKCKPIGHPQAEIAGFGWARIASQWRTNWGHTVYVLEHYTPEEI